MPAGPEREATPRARARGEVDHSPPSLIDGATGCDCRTSNCDDSSPIHPSGIPPNLPYPGSLSSGKVIAMTASTWVLTLIAVVLYSFMIRDIIEEVRG